MKCKYLHCTVLVGKPRRKKNCVAHMGELLEADR
jgi:hypothetical protein